MTTTEHPQRLMAYADGELSTVDAAAIEEHLRACPQCRRQVARLRWLQTRTIEAAPLATGSPLWPSVRGRLEPSKPVTRGYGWWRPVGYALLIVLGLGVGAWAGWSAGAGDLASTSSDLLTASSLFSDPPDGVSMIYLETMESSEVRP